MGCSISSQKVQVENYPVKSSTDTPGGGVSPANKNNTTPSNASNNNNKTTNGKKEDKLTESLENEAKQRRSVQGKTENMVREEFERGNFYFIIFIYFISL